jgi:hypothetical protein
MLVDGLLTKVRLGPSVKICNRACGAMVVLLSRWCDIFLLLPRRCISSHVHIIGIILMHTSHSCIVVTETPEDAPVEPTEFVETEPGAECVVEQEENQGKQLTMIPWPI